MHLSCRIPCANIDRVALCGQNYMSERHEVDVNRLESVAESVDEEDEDEM